jgi:hypothetical protein
MKKLFAQAIVVCILMAGCTDTKSRSTGVYMLLDTSGTYAVELNKAQKILNYLLGVLAPGETLAVARIDTGSFSERDIISKVTFDERPSVANNQKRAFMQQVEGFVTTVKGSPYTDISGGILQAIEYLARVEDWRSKVEKGGGEWGMISDLERLDNIFAN